MKRASVEGNKDLVRDLSTKAILNTNIEEYNRYIIARENKQRENQRIKSLENDIDEVKNDLIEIKNLLRSLANGSQSNNS